MKWIALSAETKDVVRDQNGDPVEWTILKVGENPINGKIYERFTGNRIGDVFITGLQCAQFYIGSRDGSGKHDDTSRLLLFGFNSDHFNIMIYRLFHLSLHYSSRGSDQTGRLRNGVLNFRVRTPFSSRCT